MAKGTEIEIKNLGEKTGIKLIADDQGKVVIATEENIPLQPSNPDGKLDEYAIHDNEAGEISALGAKASPISTDVVLGEDSENDFAKVKIAVGDLGGGGGGATTFDGLSDTPVNKTGSEGFLVKVNGVNLDFLDPATFALSGHDHSGVYSPVAHDHAGVYSPVAHDHSGVYSPVAHTHTDFLLKTGGVMSGNIDFSDVQEGIRFWDLDSAYFKAFYFDDSLGMIVIGGDAAGLGGRPNIWADSPVINVGYSGLSICALQLWNQGAGDFLPAIQFSGAVCKAGEVNLDLQLQGSAARPKYDPGTGAVDLALKSDVPVGGTYDAAAIPRYGTGELHANVINGLALILNPNEGAGVARVSARDLIHTIRGGGASLTYQLDASLTGGPGPSTTSADPTAAYLDYDVNANQTEILRVNINDGIYTHTYETYVIIQDPFGLGEVPP